MKNIALLIFFLAYFGVAEVSCRTKTTRKGLRIEKAIVENAPTDSVIAEKMIAANDSAIAFAGFDKQLSSTRETVFATNRTPHKITAIVFTIEYTDRQGRQLHRRQITVPTNIPSGETRMLSFPSFDRQKSFYYIHSRQPKTLATPFSVKCTPDSISIK